MIPPLPLLWICFTVLIVTTAAQLYGINYDTSFQGRCLSQGEVNVEAMMLTSYANRIRTLSMLTCQGGERVVEAARVNGLKAVVTVAISSSSAAAELIELQRVLKLRDYTGVVEAVCVGTDTQTKGNATVPQLQQYISELRTLLNDVNYTQTRICIADTYAGYSKTEDCTAGLFGLTGVDSFLVNIVPFYEVPHASMAVFFADQLNQTRMLARRCGGQGTAAKVGVGRSGWPTAGLTPDSSTNPMPFNFASDYSLVQYLQAILPLVTGVNALPYYHALAYDTGTSWTDPEQHFGILLRQQNTTAKPGINAVMKRFWSKFQEDPIDTLPVLPADRVYSACYEDSPALPSFPFKLAVGLVSVDQCAAIALAHNIKLRFIGMTLNNECWAGFLSPANFNGNPSVDPSRCKFSCSGIPGVGEAVEVYACGSNSTMAAYELINFELPAWNSSTPSPPKPPSNTPWQQQKSWVPPLSNTEFITIVAAPTGAIVLVAALISFFVYRRNSRAPTVWVQPPTTSRASTAGIPPMAWGPHTAVYGVSTRNSTFQDKDSESSYTNASRATFNNNNDYRQQHLSIPRGAGF